MVRRVTTGGKIMATVDLTVRGRVYTVGCADGEEADVRELGKIVGKKIDMLVAGGLQASDAHLLLLVSLMLAEEQSFEKPGEVPADLLQDAPHEYVADQTTQGRLDEERLQDLVGRIQDMRKSIDDLARSLAKL